MAQTCEWPPRAGSANGHLDVSLLANNQEVHQTQAPNQAQNQRIARNRLRLRRQRLVENLHRLGPSPLGHFIREVEMSTGTDVTARLEKYAALDHEFIKALGGDKFPPPFLQAIGGGKR